MPHRLTDALMPAHTRPSPAPGPTDTPLHPQKPAEPVAAPPLRSPPSPLDPQPTSCPALDPSPQGADSPTLHTFDALLPVADPPPERSTPRDNAPSEAAKRRPLPTPPSRLQHSPSSSELHRISHLIPSSPPPPYSMSLPAEDPVPMTRDLSRLSTSTSHTAPAPEAPVILTPNEQSAQGRAPCDTFLCHSPPANTWISVETSPSEYVLVVRLPGFRRDGITIATRRRRILHVVADSWEPEGGHFERRVSFGYDAELAQVRAEFDGEILRIIVPRHISAISS